MPTLQQWVDREKAAGSTGAEITAAFKEAYGDDIATLDADADYDAYKASKQAKPPAPAPAPVAQPQKPAAPAVGAPVKPPPVAAPVAKPPVAQPPSESIDLPGSGDTTLPSGEEGPEMELRLPTPQRVFDRGVGQFVGAAKGVGAAHHRVGEARDTFVYEVKIVLAAEQVARVTRFGVSVAVLRLHKH
jgi:hypothetical protein